MGLIGKLKQCDIKDAVWEWTLKIHKENYKLDKRIIDMKRNETYLRENLTEAIIHDDKPLCAHIADQIVQGRKRMKRCHLSISHLKTVQINIQMQLSQLSEMGSLQRSDEIIETMQNLYRYPEISTLIQELSMELMKLGVIDETDIAPGPVPVEEIEASNEAEIAQILWEMSQGQTTGEPLKPPSPAPSIGTAVQQGSSCNLLDAEEDDDEEDHVNYHENEDEEKEENHEN